MDGLRAFLGTLGDDIRAVAGDVKVVLALRKLKSIGNTVVRNRKLSETSTEMEDSEEEFSQRCGGGGCMTCPLMSSAPTLSVNGKRLKLNPRLNCKSRNVIYAAQCSMCSRAPGTRKEDTYIGQTMQPFHKRVNGHRGKFSELEHKKSALAQHCWEKHRDAMDLNIFKFGLVKQVSALGLDRAESKLIDNYRTKLFGLNRILVIR